MDGLRLTPWSPYRMSFCVRNGSTSNLKSPSLSLSVIWLFVFNIQLFFIYFLRLSYCFTSYSQKETHHTLPSSPIKSNSPVSSGESLQHKSYSGLPTSLRRSVSTSFSLGPLFWHLRTGPPSFLESRILPDFPLVGPILYHTLFFSLWHLLTVLLSGPLRPTTCGTVHDKSQT